MGKKNHFKKIMKNFKLFLYGLSICLLAFSSVKSEILNEISISGNSRVSDETIKVYGDIDLKKDIDEIIINKILKSLYSTDFFEDVNIKIENKILYIQVKEYPIINQLILVGEPSKELKNKLKR